MPALELTHRGCVRDPALATEFDLVDRDDDDAVAATRAQRRVEREPKVSRATGALVPAWVPEDGWLTRVELTLSQGRHHQVRRLCKLAGLRLRHLRRVAVGPVTLDGVGLVDQPGAVRVLSREQKAELYRVCLPRLIESQGQEGARRRGSPSPVACAS